MVFSLLLILIVRKKTMLKKTVALIIKSTALIPFFSFSMEHPNRAIVPKTNPQSNVSQNTSGTNSSARKQRSYLDKGKDKVVEESEGESPTSEEVSFSQMVQLDKLSFAPTVQLLVQFNQNNNLGKEKDYVEYELSFIKELINDLPGPQSVRIPKTWDQVVVTKTNAGLLLISVLTGVLGWFTRSHEFLPAGCLAGGSLAALYGVRSTYQDYNTPNVGEGDEAFRKELKTLLKTHKDNDDTTLALASVYFKDLSSDINIDTDTLAKHAKGLLELIAAGTIAVESSPDKKFVLYTGSKMDNGFTITTLASISTFITQCTQLYCSGNRPFGFIKKGVEVPRFIQLFTNLQKLTITDAKWISSAILSLPQLRSLKIVNCVVSTPGLIEQLHDNPIIEELTVYNNLKDFDLADHSESLYNLPNLTKLDLNNNTLTELPTKILRLTALTELSVSHNQLELISKKISSLTNLTILNLSNNQIKKLPQEITDLTNLTELDVSHNKLISLPKTIDQMSNLAVCIIKNPAWKNEESRKNLPTTIRYRTTPYNKRALKN